MPGSTRASRAPIKFMIGCCAKLCATAAAKSGFVGFISRSPQVCSEHLDFSFETWTKRKSLLKILLSFFRFTLHESNYAARFIPARVLWVRIDEVLELHSRVHERRLSRLFKSRWIRRETVLQVREPFGHLSLQHP